MDGEFLFAYTLPRRQPGAVQLMAYDAVTEFHGIDVWNLPAQVVLEKAGDAVTAPVTAETIKLAEARLGLAKAEYAFDMARVDADNAALRKEGSGSAEAGGEKSDRSRVGKGES